MPFWSVPTTNTSTDPYITGSWPRLQRAVSWASKYDISVIIDIHGAPGSQNGYDNSGQRMSYPQWQTDAANVNHTLQVFQALINEFGDADKWGGTVGAIEALNEPAGFDEDVRTTMNAYWKSAYELLKEMRLQKGTEDAEGVVDDNEIKMVIMDGFTGVQNYQTFLTSPDAEGVMMDTVCTPFHFLSFSPLRQSAQHHYQIFNPSQEVLDHDGLISLACATGPDIVQKAAGGLWTYVGEWSTSPTDCTPWLNGRFVGSDWVNAVDGRTCAGTTGSYQDFTDDYKSFLAQ